MSTKRVDALASARRNMNDVRQRIWRLVEERTDAQLLTPPADGGWSPAEVIDHLRTSETKLVKGLSRVEAGQPVRLPRRAYFYRLPMGLAFTERKIKAPGPVRPRPAAEIVPHESIEALKTSRAELFALADRLGPERFSRLLFPHFLLGRFDGLDWFRFIGRHEARHLAQMERVLGGAAA